MTNTTKDITDLTPEDCDRIVDLFMEYGERLAAKDEWDMDDNFDTTEALYALYCDITGHGDPTRMYPVYDWKFDVAMDLTTLGYEEWAVHKMESNRT